MCTSHATLRVMEGSITMFMCDHHGAKAFEYPDLVIRAARTPSYVRCGSVRLSYVTPLSYAPALVAGRTASYGQEV